MISLGELSELLNQHSIFTIGSLTIAVVMLYILFLTYYKKKKQDVTGQTTKLDDNAELKLLAKRIAKLEKVLAFKEEPNLPTSSVSPISNASREEIRNIELEKIIATKKAALKTESSQETISALEQDINRLNTLKREELQGGKGKLNVNLAWETIDDLDLSVITPNGTIDLGNLGIGVNVDGVLGMLDLDANADDDKAVRNPQENILWTEIPTGEFRIVVNLYKRRVNEVVPFIVTVTQKEGKTVVFDRKIQQEKEEMLIAKFEFIDGELHIKEIV
jgi:hypothetical protein